MTNYHHNEKKRESIVLKQQNDKSILMQILTLYYACNIDIFFEDNEEALSKQEKSFNDFYACFFISELSLQIMHSLFASFSS